MARTDVAIIGGGLAGLSCAVELVARGAACTVFEASDRAGGRVRTDPFEGFLLDRGFQVLLTAYPETRRTLDYASLQLGRFHSGAVVRARGAFHTFADPFREILSAVATVRAPVGSVADKLRVAKLRAAVSAGPLSRLFARPDVSTLDALQGRGFSSGMIRSFFRPFLGGIFLEPDLVTSSRKFEFVFRMFAEGDAALPASGMGEIATQLAERLPRASLRLRSPVRTISERGLRLESGETIEAEYVVLATDELAAARLLRQPVPSGSGSVVCLYYDAPESPVNGPWLVLNGEPGGPINNLCVPTEVNRTYGRGGRSLVSVSVLGRPQASDELLQKQVRSQLMQWYGAVVKSWRHLRTYRIPYAVPLQSPGSLEPSAKPVRISERLFRCGDYTDVASIQGAMISGRRVAQALLSITGVR